MMNKFKLFIISLCTIIGIGICNASNVDSLITELYTGSKVINGSTYTNIFNYGNNGSGTYCIKFIAGAPTTLTMGFANGGTTAPSNLYTLYNDQYENRICLYGNKPYFNVKLSINDTIGVLYHVFKITDLLNTTIPNQNCPTCEEQYTSLQCQTEYNLIPLESITENYCTSNFNLINPSSCPICEGSGAISWSSLFINNVQYSSNDNISIDIPEDIGYDITYTDYETNVYVEGYNADEDYINAIIDNEKLTPTAEDFATLLQGTAEFIPYIFIAFIIGFTRYLIKKLW